MTPHRHRETIQAQLTALTALLEGTPPDPLTTPMLEQHIAELKTTLASLDHRPPLAPEAEIFFTGGPAVGTQGLDATFASEILNSYQNMVTNHYAAKHHGTLRRAGRRRGEKDAKLFLTALPRGSFGLQLSQPIVSDWVAAGHVSEVLTDISGLLQAAAETDEAFETSLATFNPRVLKPLQRFIEALFAGEGECRVVTGFKELVLNRTQIADACRRVTDAKEEEETITLHGVFGGVLTFSWEFDFQRETGELIRGPLADTVGEETAAEWNLKLTHKPVAATLVATTVSTRTGKKKPSYELLGLQRVAERPDPAPKQ